MGTGKVILISLLVSAPVAMAVLAIATRTNFPAIGRLSVNPPAPSAPAAG